MLAIIICVGARKLYQNKCQVGVLPHLPYRLYVTVGKGEMKPISTMVICNS